jgi:rod shape-determining protein MreC
MRKNLRKISLVLFIVLGVVFLNKYILNNFLQVAFYHLATKPGVFLTRELNKLSKYAASFLNTGAIIRENNELKEENRALLGHIAELEGLGRENEFLRNELKVAPRLGSRLLIADIFSIQKNALSSTALINKGKADGVKESMAVITSGNILVGVVNEVFDNSALILLLDDPRSTVSVRFQGSNVLAEARGDLQNNLKINEVTYKEEIKEGDMIVTSGLDGLKESLLVGRVSEVKPGSGGLFRKVAAKPMFDLSLGSELFVVLK